MSYLSKALNARARYFIRCPILIGMLVGCLPLFGQNSPTTPSLHIPKLGGVMTVDGRMDEIQWQKAANVSGYYPLDPVEEGPIPGETDARIFYDDRAIYFGFVCRFNEAGNIRAHIAPREDVNQDDQVGIYLDTYNDDRQMFVFYINALGIQQDARMVDGGDWNMSWDAVFRSKGVVADDHFVVEVAIPFRSLRFPNLENQEWGLILTRKFAAQGVKAVWPKVTRHQTKFVAQAATVTGLSGISSGKHLELQPTLVTQWGQAANNSEKTLESPYTLDVPGGVSVAPGMTAKYGLTSNLTLDAALNPDFSQVESDPDQFTANNRFRLLFYQERRPFFLEGSEIFEANYLGFHSRSIVSPLWGLKFTGKQNGTAMGLVIAYDTAPAQSLTTSTVSERGTPGLEEDDLYNEDGSSRHAMITQARISQDLPSGANFGFTFADKEIVDPNSGQWFGFHHYAAYDALLHLGKHDRVSGSVEYSATGMRGGDAVVGPGYFTAYQHVDDHLTITSSYGYESPYFRAETSFLPLVGVHFTEQYFAYRIDPKLKPIVFIRPQLRGGGFYDPRVAAITDIEASPQLNTRFKNQIYLNAGLGYHYERYDETIFNQNGFGIDLESETFDTVSFAAGWEEGERIYYQELESSPDTALGYSIATGGSMTVRPLTWFKTELSAKHETFLATKQFSGLYALNLLTDNVVPDKRFEQLILAGTANVNLTAALGLRGIVQYHSRAIAANQTGDLNWNVLFTYLPSPGTAAYLGVSHGNKQSEKVWSEEASTWRVFFKLSYLWRI